MTQGWFAFVPDSTPRRLALAGFAAGLVATVAIIAGTLASAEPKAPPSGAPSGSQPIGEPGAPADAKPLAPPAQGEVEVHGRIHLFPPGSVPSARPTWEVKIGDPRTVGYDLQDAEAVSRLGARGFSGVSPRAPRGFAVDIAELQLAPNDSGVTIPAHAFYRFTAPDQYEVNVGVHKLRDGEVLEWGVFEPATGFATSAVDLAGVEVLIIGGTAAARVQGPREALFVLADHLVWVDGTALDPGVLIEFVENWIVDHKAVYASYLHRQ